MNRTRLILVWLTVLIGVVGLFKGDNLYTPILLTGCMLIVLTSAIDYTRKGQRAGAFFYYLSASLILGFIFVIV